MLPFYPDIKPNRSPGPLPLHEHDGLPVSLVGMGYSLVEGTRRIHWNNPHRPLHRGPYAVFQYTLAGAGHFRGSVGEVALDRKKAFIVRVPSQTAYWLERGEHWEWIWLGFRGTWADTFVAELNDGYGEVLSLPADCEPIRVFAETYNTYAGGKRLSAWQLAGTAFRFLMELRHHLETGRRRVPSPVARGIELIDGNLGNAGFDLSELAEEVGLSKYYFSRLFRETTGQSPGAYLTNKRLAQANHLLHFTQWPVKQIAYEVGFGSHVHFTAAFRKHYGKPPSALRR